MKDPRKPNAVDLHIAKKLREIRREKNVSQEDLAAGVGLTFQQIQKYERATNRVSASRLFKIAKILETPLASFFPS